MQFNSTKPTKESVKAIYESTFTKTSFANRTPDGIIKLCNLTGVFSILMFIEVKGRYSDGDFNNSDIGQVVDMLTAFLETNPLHDYALAALTDGLRFNYIRANRSFGSDALTFESSSVHTNLIGWQVCN